MIDGNGGSDILVGSDAADVIVAEGGPSLALGLGGDDAISVANGVADSVSCGAGNDGVVMDASPSVHDTVSADCEVHVT